MGRRFGLPEANTAAATASALALSLRAAGLDAAFDFITPALVRIGANSPPPRYSVWFIIGGNNN